MSQILLYVREGRPCSKHTRERVLHSDLPQNKKRRFRFSQSYDFYLVTPVPITQNKRRLGKEDRGERKLTVPDSETDEGQSSVIETSLGMFRFSTLTPVILIVCSSSTSSVRNEDVSSSDSTDYTGSGKGCPGVTIPDPSRTLRTPGTWKKPTQGAVSVPVFSGLGPEKGKYSSRSIRILSTIYEIKNFL